MSVLDVPTVESTFPVASYGAVGDGQTDDGPAIQAAIDAAYAAGGGTVMLSRGAVHGWSGEIVVKNAVILAGTAARQYGIDILVPGLLALDATAHVAIGKWNVGVAAQPGGARDLYVDGAGVGGAAAELVRVAGVDLFVEHVHVVRSAGDGIVFDNVQNSTVVAGYSVEHVGAALALDNGSGNVTFVGGYFGHADRALHIRETPNQNNGYFFGTSGCNFYNTIFERYERNRTEHALIVVECGQHNVFHNVNFSNGSSKVSDDCLVLINSSAYPGIATMVEFDSTFSYPGPASAPLTDVFRIVGSQPVTFSGDGFVDQGKNLICQDSGSAPVALTGTFSYLLPSLQFRRAINGGTFANWYNTRRTADHYRIADGSSAVEVRREADAQPRGYVGPDLDLAWQNGSDTKVRASLAHDGAGMLTMSARMTHTGGLVRTVNQVSVDSSSATVALDCAAAYEHHLSFTRDGAGIGSLTLSNAVDGAEVRIGVAWSGTNQVAWPANLSWAGGKAPAITDGAWTFVTLQCITGNWYESSRAEAVAKA